MISDVLGEAYEAITDYLNDPVFSTLYDEEIRVKITSLLNTMEELRVELDTCPPGNPLFSNEVKQDPGNQEKPFVQIAGCCFHGLHEVKSFVSNQEAEFYSLYLGKPGNYRFITNGTRDVLLKISNRLLEKGSIQGIDDATFD